MGLPNVTARGYAAIAAGLIMSTGLLSYVAVANGYPLLFSDTGTYLRIGFDLAYPDDRPPVYGLVIAPFVRLGGLWGVVVLQGLCATLAIAAAVWVVRGRLRGWEVALAVVVLAAASSLPWFTGQVMPDLATGFTCLVGFVAAAAPRGLPRWARWLLVTVLAALIAMHLSHILLATALVILAGGVLALMRRPAVEIMRRCAPVAGAILLACVTLSGMNLIAMGLFKPSLSTDMFTLARLFDGRLAQPILERRCRTEHLLLCAELPVVTDPATTIPGQDFLWSPRSPLHRLASRDPVGVRREEAALIRDTIRSRPGAVLKLAFTGWGKQLVTARTGRIGQYSAESSVYRQIAAHLPGELGAMRGSLQQRGALLRLMPGWDVAMVTAIAILALSPLLLWRARHAGRPRLLGFGLLVVATIVINAAITGALSGPDDRYQSRVLWLLPLFAILTWLDTRRHHATPAGI